MSFPFSLPVVVQTPAAPVSHEIKIHSGVTVLLGPNGSGKTQLMRSMKKSLSNKALGLKTPEGVTVNKHVRFLSAGRIGRLEDFRSDFDGNRGGAPNYDGDRIGSLDDKKRRHRFETLQGDFLTLSDRPDILVKTRERLRKLFGRDLFLEWSAGNLRISFSSISGSTTQYSSAREASGLMHLAGLLSALYDDDVSALFIDEPEVSLHPQLQSFLLDEINSVAGYPEHSGNKKIIVLATHSTEFISLNTPHDLPNLVFCRGYAKTPIQVPTDANELKSRKIAELIGRMGQEHKLALFANSPVLVEGVSDAVVSSAVASKLSVNLEAGGAQILPVVGKGEFPTVAKLFRLMGKSPVVMTDCDGLADDINLANFYLNSEKGNELAAAKGAASGTALSASIYSDFCDIVTKNWGDVANIAQHEASLVTSASDKDQTMAKRRAAMSFLLSCGEDTLNELANSKDWINTKKRLDVLLEILEQLGCFILRNGAIEDYYVFTNPADFRSKPEAGVNEAIEVRNAPASQVEIPYDDVARCLRYASDTQDLNEGEAILNLLLACTAPLQAALKSGDLASNPNDLAKSILGDQAQIFEFSWDKNELVVGLNSKILNVKGFPIRVKADVDIVTTCVQKLGLA